MSHVSKTPFDLTMHLVSVGGNSDGGWIPGNGFPNPQVGRIGQRYVDVQSGHVYGPKTRDGWPSEHTHTLNLGNVAGEFANMLSRVPALEVRASNLESRTTVLEGRADSAADLAIEHHVSLQEHGLRIDTLEADNLEIRRRLGMVDSTLSARMLAAEDALSDLSRLRGLDIADFNSRLSTLTTELNGNSSTLNTLQESYTSMSQTWTQEVTTLRSEFNGNIATLQQTLRTHADRHSATSELLTTLTARVDSNAAAITSESRTRADDYAAMAEQITTLSAQSAASTATLTSQQTALASEVEAYASTVLALDAQMGNNTAAFQEEIQTLVTADEALALRVSTLDVATEDLDGRITTEESARISGDSAVLTSAREMVATSESDTAVRIAEESAARLSGDQAEAYQRGLLDTKFTNQGDTLRAAITAESTARSNAISAETTARNQQISTVNTKIGGIQTQVTNLNAAITAESSTRANAIAAETSARNQQISSLNINIGQVSAAVSQEASTRATVDGYLGSRYTLSASTASNGVVSVAGLEIASTSAAGREATGHVAIFADRFYITHSQSLAIAAPFEVVGGNVYIRSAIIQDASITSAKIKDATITSAKIGAAAVDTLKIAGNAVTVPVIATTNGVAPSATIHLSEPGYVLAIASVNLFANPNSENEVSLNINGQGEVSVSVVENYSTALTACYGFNLPAGSHTFNANIGFPAGYYSIRNCSLVLMGAKR